MALQKIIVMVLSLWIVTAKCDVQDSLFVDQVQNLPDLSHQVIEHNMPTMHLAYPNDGRIEKLALEKRIPFRVETQGSPRYVVIIDPHRKTGHLWWRRSYRMVLETERLNRIESGQEDFTPEEKKFLTGIKL